MPRLHHADDRSTERNRDEKQVEQAVGKELDLEDGNIAKHASSVRHRMRCIRLHRKRVLPVLHGLNIARPCWRTGQRFSIVRQVLTASAATPDELCRRSFPAPNSITTKAMRSVSCSSTSGRRRHQPAAVRRYLRRVPVRPENRRDAPLAVVADSARLCTSSQAGEIGEPIARSGPTRLAVVGELTGTEAIRRKELSARLKGNVKVELGMSYGEPVDRRRTRRLLANIAAGIVAAALPAVLHHDDGVGVRCGEQGPAAAAGYPSSDSSTITTTSAATSRRSRLACETTVPTAGAATGCSFHFTAYRVSRSKRRPVPLPLPKDRPPRRRGARSRGYRMAAQLPVACRPAGMVATVHRRDHHAAR